MKKEIKLQDPNASKNSLFTLNKIPSFNAYKSLKLEDNNYSKINKVKQNQEPRLSAKRKYSDKKTKVKDFNSKLKNFIKQSDSNSVASQRNGSLILKKENSIASVKQKPIIPINNQSKILKTSKKCEIKNYVTSSANDIYCNSNSIEQNFFKTQSEEFNNSIESCNNPCEKSILKAKNYNIHKEVSTNLENLDLRIGEKQVSEEFGIISEDIIKRNIADNVQNNTIKNKNRDIIIENNFDSFNKDYVNDTCTVFSSIANKIENSEQSVPNINDEETKSIFANKFNYNFKTQEKINIINLNDPCHDKAFSEKSYNHNTFLLQKKDNPINLKGCKDYQLNRKQCSTSLLNINNKNNLKYDKNMNFISENKNSENKHLILIKNKTANKIQHFEKEIKKAKSNISNGNVYLQTAPVDRMNSSYTKKHSGNSANKNIKSFYQNNSNERFKRKSSIKDNHNKIRKNLKDSKSENTRFLEIDLNINSSSNENSEYFLSNIQKLENPKKITKVKILDENEVNVEIKNFESYNNNFNNFLNKDYLDLGFQEKNSTKNFKNNSTKSIFYQNQSSKFLINLLNSNDSSYFDKLICIVNKFKLYLEKLIIFISINENSSDNFSIFKNISNNILNACFSNNQLNYSDLIYEYCLESQIKPADLKVNDLIKNLEKNIRFQFEDALLGISPILLDCNIIRQNFLESNSKSRKNVLPITFTCNPILEKNLDLIIGSSESRIEQIKVIFKEMLGNLVEIKSLLVNEFSENLTKKLEEFRTQDFNLIFNRISNLNTTATSCTLLANKNDNHKNEILENNLSKLTKFKSEKIPRTSKVIEIDIANDQNNIFIKKNKTLTEYRKSLKEILECEVNLKEEDLIAKINMKNKNNDNQNFNFNNNSNNNKNEVFEITRFSVLKDDRDIKRNSKEETNKPESSSKEKIKKKNYSIINTPSNNSKTRKEDEIHNLKEIRISNSILKSFQNGLNKKLIKPSNNSYNKKNKTIPKSEKIDFKLLNNSKQDTKTPLKKPKKTKINLTLIPNKSLLLKSHAENKENYKKTINKKKLRIIKIKSDLDSANKNIEKLEGLKNNITKQEMERKEKCNLQAIEQNNDKTISPAALDISKSTNINEMNFENQNLNIDDFNIDKYNLIGNNNYNTNNIVENKNYININLNLNPIVTNILQEDNTFQIKNKNSWFESYNYSKSDKNVSLFNSVDSKSRNCKKKFIFNSFPKTYFAYSNFTNLVGQRRSKMEKCKIMNKNFEHKNSIFSKTSLEESDLMASIDEFESNEKVHLNIPNSKINYANMPICGSKIIRRHSSFSKVLEMFNYKRFFNFKKKSSFLSPNKSSSINKKNFNPSDQNKNSNNYDVNEKLQSNQQKKNNYNCVCIDKYLNKNKDQYIKNEKYLNDSADIKTFNQKKINDDSYNISEINSSAPDLSLSTSEVCNDLFNCCENIELKERLSLIKLKKKSSLINKQIKQSEKIIAPKQLKSRSVLNLMIVNINK